MGFANVDEEEVGLVSLVLVPVFDVTDIAPKRPSRVAGKHQRSRSSTEFRHRDLSFTVFGVEGEIGRNVARHRADTASSGRSLCQCRSCGDDYEQDHYFPGFHKSRPHQAAVLYMLVTKVCRDKFNRYVVGGGVQVFKIIGLPDQRRTTYDSVTFRTEVVPDCLMTSSSSR